MVNKSDFADYSFKCKGKAHKVINNKAPAQINPEVVKSINEFVALFATESRYKQFSDQIGAFDTKKTNEFIAAFSKDVAKESTCELEVAGLTWQQVSKAVSNVARKWWLEKCKEI